MRNFQHEMAVKRSPGVAFPDFMAFEPFVKRRNQESAGLCPDALERLLGLNDKDAEKVPGVDTFLEVWLFLMDEVIEAPHGLMIFVPVATYLAQ